MRRRNRSPCHAICRSRQNHRNSPYVHWSYSKRFCNTLSVDDSFDPVVARNSEVLDSNPSSIAYLSSVCAYTVLKTIRKPGACNAVYDTVHYENSWSHAIRDFWVGHSPGFRLLFVSLLPWLCRKKRKAIYTFCKIQRVIREMSYCFSKYILLMLESWRLYWELTGSC